MNTDGWMRELVERNEAGLYARAGDPARPGARRSRGCATTRELARRYGRERAPRWPSASSTATSSAERLLGVLEEAARR